MTRRDPERGSTEIIVFGRHPVNAALRSEGVEVLGLALAKGASGPERKRLRGEAVSREIPFEELSRSELSRLTNAERHDQGIAARVRLLKVIEGEAFLDALKGRAARQPIRLMALDGVTNSQNVGMVVRSVVGAGLHGMLWPIVGQPWL